MDMGNYYKVEPEKEQEINISDKFKRSVIFHAFTHALNSKISNGRHCAIVFYETWDNIVSMSVNDNVKHAEVSAIESISDNVDLNKCFVMVVRATMSGKMTMSMPCNKCKQALRRHGIKTCIYSEDHFKFKRYIV